MIIKTPRPKAFYHINSPPGFILCMPRRLWEYSSFSLNTSIFSYAKGDGWRWRKWKRYVLFPFEILAGVLWFLMVSHALCVSSQDLFTTWASFPELPKQYVMIIMLILHVTLFEFSSKRKKTKGCFVRNNIQTLILIKTLFINIPKHVFYNEHARTPSSNFNYMYMANWLYMNTVLSKLIVIKLDVNCTKSYGLMLICQYFQWCYITCTLGYICLLCEYVMS